MAPSTPRRTTPTDDWLSKMRQQFLDGTNCDMIVKVRLDSPPAKRARQGTGNQQQDRIVEIPAHSLVLSTRSEYFTNALRACAPGGTKTVEISLPEEATVPDLRLLFKLSYGTTYIRDKDTLIHKPTRLRLALLAQTFAFKDCVSEVIVSLGENLTLKGALTLLDDLPEEVREHPSVPELKLKVIKALAKGIDTLAGKVVQGEAAEARKRQQLQEAGDALAKALGPVHKLFEEGSLQNRFPTGAFYEVLPLKPFVKNFSPAVMGALLGSDKLVIGAEEETYYLLGAYLHQCNHVTAANRTAQFKALVKNIRFHHISSEYLANVVTCCPLAIDSGLMSSFLSSALVYRDVDTRIAGAKGVKLGAARRGSGREEWSFDSKFLLADMMKVEKERHLSRLLGVAGGYPVAVNLERKKEEKFGAYVHAFMPKSPAESFEGCLERRAGFRYTLQLGSMEKSLSYFVRQGRGWSDFFSKPWDEVVCKNSDQFTKSELPVVLTMKKLKK